MNPTIENSWKKALKNEFDATYFLEIKKFLTEKKQYIIYPPGNEIFNAYNLTPLNKVKVVIIGQDPYHGPSQAHGLCFSVRKGTRQPPSLINIFKEQVTDLGINYPTHGDLTPWATQGVLLLNATLTVTQHEANSHQNVGWQKFTDATIRTVSEQCKGVVFLLWGGFAKRKTKLIDTSKQHVLTSGHPSPLSANRGYWFGNKHFSQTNNILQKQDKQPINWQVE
ncbi:MAG: uracil-DNA glycosylase [Flavobacteriales bacterium]|nr:uracil-DNA glycosylase [Flavobacteriales bacterium]